MRQEEAILVRNMPLFDGLNDAEFRTLLQGAYLQWFPPHVELIREGDPADFLYVVHEGLIELFARFRDRENTIAVIGPASTFISAAVMLDRPYLKSARVLESSRLLMIPAENVRGLFASSSAFTKTMARELATGYRTVVKELKNQKLRNTLERSAAWLIRQNDIQGGSGTITMPFEKRILASQLGMQPEVLSRTFVTLRPYGVLVSGRKIALSDLTSLQRLAVPDDLIDNPVS